MFSRTDTSFELRLRNAEGIPVLSLAGSLTKAALKAVDLTLARLAGAGHYNIILNVERLNISNWRLLSGLAGTIRRIKAHYGAVDLVATQDRIQQLLRFERVAGLFRLCRSENQAISLIKRLQRQPERVSKTNARLLEQS